MGQPARLAELVEGKLGAIVAGIEAAGTEVDRIGAIRHRGPHRVERTRRREQLRDADTTLGGVRPLRPRRAARPSRGRLVGARKLSAR